MLPINRTISSVEASVRSAISVNESRLASAQAPQPPKFARTFGQAVVNAGINASTRTEFGDVVRQAAKARKAMTKAVGDGYAAYAAANKDLDALLTIAGHITDGEKLSNRLDPAIRASASTLRAATASGAVNGDAIAQSIIRDVGAARARLDNANHHLRSKAGPAARLAGTNASAKYFRTIAAATGDPRYVKLRDAYQAGYEKRLHEHRIKLKGARR